MKSYNNVAKLSSIMDQPKTRYVTASLISIVKREPKAVTSTLKLMFVRVKRS